jgi:Tol biopolymer transport system component
MSDQLRLERNLPEVLEDLYLGGTPAYRDEVLQAVAHVRQRPTWTFPERWFPMADITARFAFVPRLPIRTLIVAVLLLALVVATIAFIGSQQRKLPPPFGPARNGLIVYSLDGELFTVDAASGKSRALVSSPMVERQPVISPDGTQVAFLRGEPRGAENAFALVVIDIDGSGERVIEASNVGDADAIVWAPDGSFLLRNSGDEEIVRYDLPSGSRKVIAAAAILQAEALRPPAGDRVLFFHSLEQSLWSIGVDGESATLLHAIPQAERSDCDFDNARWSPDGTMIAFRRQPPGEPGACRAYVMAADGTGARQLSTDPGLWVEADLRWSPDSAHVAFNRWKETDSGGFVIQPIGVVSGQGGSVRSVGPTPVADGAAFAWSPDGTTLISLAGGAVGWAPVDRVQEARPMLIDVPTSESREASWSMSSWPAWQRLALESQP